MLFRWRLAQGTSSLGERSKTLTNGSQFEILVYIYIYIYIYGKVQRGQCVFTPGGYLKM